MRDQQEVNLGTSSSYWETNNRKPGEPTAVYGRPTRVNLGTSSSYGKTDNSNFGVSGSNLQYSLNSMLYYSMLSFWDNPQLRS
jgi:hypothetical protein